MHKTKSNGYRFDTDVTENARNGLTNVSHPSMVITDELVAHEVAVKQVLRNSVVVFLVGVYPSHPSPRVCSGRIAFREGFTTTWVP